MTDLDFAVQIPKRGKNSEEAFAHFETEALAEEYVMLYNKLYAREGEQAKVIGLVESEWVEFYPEGTRDYNDLVAKYK